MRGLVETFESASTSNAHRTCWKQRRLFRALYDVAVKYIEVKSRAEGAKGRMSWPMARQQNTDTFAGSASSGLPFSPLDSGGILGDIGTANISDSPVHIPSRAETNGDTLGHLDGLAGPTTLQNTAFGDVGMDMDLSGAQLWDWFNKNQTLMMMLEDT